MSGTHEDAMRAAIVEAERARGSTGDNPWVGCVLVDARGAIVTRGHTQGPGEDHAEIVAMAEALALGVELSSVTLYSTLEPCAFHGRTPACARAILDRGVRCVVTGILDPNPRVDGAGLSILRDAGIEVTSDVCGREITRQLAPWIFAFHPHEPRRRTRAWKASLASEREVRAAIIDWYGIDDARAAELIRQA